MDEERFEALFARTSKPLLAYLMNITRDKSLAEDIFQETYIRFLEAETARLEPREQKSYLFTTATNLARDHWRRAKLQVRWDGETEPHGEEAGAEEQFSDRHALERALSALSPQQRSLVWLAYAEGYEHSEIAHMLGLRVGSVRVLLFRARKKLTATLALMGMTRKETV